MTHIYFVRHAQPDFTVHDDRSRPLTEQGLRDREQATSFLLPRNISAVLSSPYRRARDTVGHLAEALGLTVELIADFRERRVDSVWIDDFNAFARQQWADFDYKLTDGECLSEVQARNIAALNDVLRRYAGQSVAIGSHGTALSTVIRYFDPSFGWEDFRRIQPVMPLIVHLTFEGDQCLSIGYTDPLTNHSW